MMVRMFLHDPSVRSVISPQRTNADPSDARRLGSDQIRGEQTLRCSTELRRGLLLGLRRTDDAGLGS